MQEAQAVQPNDSIQQVRLRNLISRSLSDYLYLSTIPAANFGQGRETELIDCTREDFASIDSQCIRLGPISAHPEHWIESLLSVQPDSEDQNIVRLPIAVKENTSSGVLYQPKTFKLQSNKDGEFFNKAWLHIELTLDGFLMR